MKRGCSLPFYHLIGLTYYLVLFRLFSDISKDTTVYIKNVAVDSVRSFRSKEHSLSLIHI